jgi:hypothetical protein
MAFDFIIATNQAAGLGRTTKIVLIRICSDINDGVVKNGVGIVHRSYDYLATMCECDRSTLSHSIAELVEKKILTAVPAGPNNFYKFTVSLAELRKAEPDWPSLVDEAVEKRKRKAEERKRKRVKPDPVDVREEQYQDEIEDQLEFAGEE